MKFGINNPAFLQMAGNRKSGDTESITINMNGGISGISGVGEITIKGNRSGVPATVKLDDPYRSSVGYFDNGIVTIQGTVTELNLTDNGPYMCTVNSLDLAKAHSLVQLECMGNLSTLDVSTCPDLELLYLPNCANLGSLIASSNPKLNILRLMAPGADQTNGLRTINFINSAVLSTLTLAETDIIETMYVTIPNSDVAAAIVGAINRSVTAGTIYFRQGGEYDQTVIDAATAKGWAVEDYVG